MAKKPNATPSQPRKPRLLWANPFCMLDTSSGASLTVREMLRQLVSQGYEVQILGCTIFDNPKGAGYLQRLWQGVSAPAGHIVEAHDGELTHQLLVTSNTYREKLTSDEENRWLAQYVYLLDSFKPDIVWFYGGHTLDLLIADEARSRGIPSAFYLANGNYQNSTRWCRDIDLILTDSQATADLYYKELNFTAIPLGKFIDSARYVSDSHERKNLLFINPVWEKGAGIVVQLALMLEQHRPDITLEVVEARADWTAILKEATTLLGSPRDNLPNIIVTGNSEDMRPVYGRARILLAPSLWWESSGRVLAEAMLNGIPALISNHGGMPEMIDDAGISFKFPTPCYESPYKHIPEQSELQNLFETIVRLFDDQNYYNDYVKRAQRVGREKHHIKISTRRLTQALSPLVQRKAGNRDFLLPQLKQHKHHIAGVSARPNFIASTANETELTQAIAQPELQAITRSTDATGQLPTASYPYKKNHPTDSTYDFDWKLENPIVVLDNRASLVKQGEIERLLESKAFTILAFDPASELRNLEDLPSNSNLQIFTHALLGSGQHETLHVCLDPTMSSILPPLPTEQLPPSIHQAASVITELPISTIALDSIEGLPSLDWLVLDELSDTLAILEHGEHSLQHMLLLQIRIAIQPTHSQQASLAQISLWAEQHGYRIHSMHAPRHRHYLSSNEHLKNSELEAITVIFTPDNKKLLGLSPTQQVRLAFLMDSILNAQESAYKTLEIANHPLAEKYLSAIRGLENSTLATNQVSAKEKITDDTRPPSEVIEISLADSAPGDLKISIPKQEIFRIRNIFYQHEYALPPNFKSNRKQLTIIDIGANVGCFALYAQRWGKNSKIYCFEPNPQVFHLLEKNTGHLKNIKTYQIGMGDRDGAFTLFQHPFNTGETSMVHTSQGSRAIEVTVRHSGNMLKELGVEHIDILKIDTEGSEVPIVRGLAELIPRTSIVMYEYHSLEDRAALAEMLNDFEIYDKPARDDQIVGTIKAFRKR